MADLTTEAMMIRKLSLLGVTEWSDHTDEGVIDSDVTADAIARASGEIEFGVAGRYTLAALAGSALVLQWGTALACYYLCLTRGALPPEGLQLEYEMIMERLKEVGSGNLSLPGVALAFDSRPSVSNRQVDRRFRRDTVRVIKANSTDAPTALTQDKAIDYPSIDG
jgi:phage gp36-like protein